MNTLENEHLRVVTKPLGAELISVFDKKLGRERLWNANPDVWNRHAPILFPIVGRLRDNQYTYLGKSYSLPQHGFARDSVFTLKRESESRISFTLKDTPESRSNYPFPFALQVDYTLDGNQLHVAYTVSNPAATPLYFSIGAHPGFACPLLDGEQFNDYFIEFEMAETCDRWFVNEHGLVSRFEKNYLEDTQVIPYTRDRFRDDALVFKDLNSTQVAIKSRKHEHAVVMDFTGWPYLGIWSKPDGAPFICLEPWHGIADHVNHNGDLTEKEGIMPLEPGMNFCCEFGVTFT